MSPRQQAMQRVLRAASDVARHWRPGRDSEGEGIIAELLSGLRDLGEPGECVTLVDAFRAGAEYMRRSAQVVYEGAPYCGTTIQLPRMLMPDAARIDAAAAGYGLSGPAGDTDEPGADPRMTGGAS